MSRYPGLTLHLLLTVEHILFKPCEKGPLGDIFVQYSLVVGYEIEHDVIPYIYIYIVKLKNVYIYIHTYFLRERERQRENSFAHTYIQILWRIYVYIYTHMLQSCYNTHTSTPTPSG